MQRLSFHDRPCVLAGCSGLAEGLTAQFAQVSPRRENRRLFQRSRLAVICGSVNPVTCRQLDAAEKAGFRRVHIPAEYLLGEMPLHENAGRQMMERLWQLYRQSHSLIIDSLQAEGGPLVDVHLSGASKEEIRRRISSQMGQIPRELLKRGANSRLMMIGGDTLQAFLEAVACKELRPVGELLPGVVLSKITYQGYDREIVSKSGGFGARDLLVSLDAGYHLCQEGSDRCQLDSINLNHGEVLPEKM